MPTAGTRDTFTVYQDEFQGAFIEQLAQNVDIMNAQSQGGIQYDVRQIVGDYAKETFFPTVGADAVSYRDPTSLAAASFIDLTQAELVAVKTNRTWGPFRKTLDSWRKIGMDPSMLSFVLGQQASQCVLADMLNSGVAGLVSALGAQSDVVYDATALSGTNTLTHTIMARGLQKMGEGASKIVAWLLHSTPAFDLLINQIADKVDSGYGPSIYQGTAASIGRPMVVTDSESLYLPVSGSVPVVYYVVGLTQAGLQLVLSEQSGVMTDTDLTLHNACGIVRSEHAYNVGIKGFAWDVSNGGVNPTDATLATATNWDKVVTSHKDLAGVLIKVDG